MNIGLFGNLETNFRHHIHKMVKKAKNLRNLNVVLAFAGALAGKPLPTSTVLSVKEFYENDLRSRIMPYKKDTFSVVIDGKKLKEQKRLLLSDIKTLHIQFKEQYLVNLIGLTKFLELRPNQTVA